MEAEKSLWQQMNDKLWEHMPDELLDAYYILKRGYCICEVKEETNKEGGKTGQKDILIVGLNPSYPKNKKENKGEPTYRLNENMKHRYWTDVKSLLYKKEPYCNLYNKAAYIDVFSCRESDQKTVENAIICNPFLKPYVIAQVEATQTIIETVIKPKVIIIKNQLAWVFFGTNPKYTWMGYSFEKIGNYNDFEVCRITGFSDKNDRVNQLSLKDTNLKGSIVVFANHTDVEKYPDPQTIKDWVENGYQ